MTDEKQLTDLFRQLHRDVVEKLIARLKEKDCPAAILKEAREMLRDNNITDAGRQLNAPIRRLAKQLPFTDPEADAV